jgi:hypothetical protein
MKQKIDTKLFVGLIVLVALVAGAVIYKALQPPAPFKVQPSDKPMFNPGSAEYKQAMQESMNRSAPTSGGSQYRSGYMNMSHGSGSR